MNLCVRIKIMNFQVRKGREGRSLFYRVYYGLWMYYHVLKMAANMRHQPYQIFPSHLMARMSISNISRAQLRLVLPTLIPPLPLAIPT